MGGIRIPYPPRTTKVPVTRLAKHEERLHKILCAEELRERLGG